MDATFIINCLETNNLDLVDIDPLKMCRTCISSAGEDGRSLYETTGVLKNELGVNYNIYEIVQFLTGTSVQFEDGLPQTICRPCVKQLFTAFNFLSQAKRIDTAFRTYIRAKDPNAAAEECPVPEESTADCVKVEKAVAKEPKTSGTVPLEPNPIVIENNQEEQEDEPELQVIEEDVEIITKLPPAPPPPAKRASPTKRRSSPAKTPRSPTKRAMVKPPTTTTKAVPEKRRVVNGERGGSSQAQRSVETTGTVTPSPEKKPALTNRVSNFHCKQCNKSYTHVQALNRHQSTVHDEGDREKKECQYCNRVFNRADGLKRHIRTHTNERPYSCKYCDKKFKQGNELKDHMLTHTKDVFFQCEICLRTLTTRMGYYYHMKSHTREAAANDESEEREDDRRQRPRARKTRGGDF